MRRYEALLNAVPDPAVPSITARVIGESSRAFVETMILNAGTDAGVKRGQAVLDDRGLLGRIYLTGARTSWVIALTDLNSRVPVMIESSHRRAILAGDNTPVPALDLDLGEGAVKPGDRVVSTGDGGLLPPGLPVGVVIGDQGPNQGGWRVALYAAPDGSDFVHVLAYTAPVEPLAAGDALPATAPLIPATAQPSEAVKRVPVPAPAPAPKAKIAAPAPSLPDGEEDR
jgi:rod shape-determining protein MreC